MLLDVRVIPNATRSGIAGMREGRLLLRISAPAVDGKANRAATLHLAKVCGVSKSRVRLVSGEKSRHKKFEIVGLNAAQEQTLLADLLKSERQ
jgi:uncharacterized protein (TIGR00251 family)